MDFSDFSIDSESKVKRYYQLENFIQCKIQNGIFQPNKKLPSVRSLSSIVNLSKNTVTRAYSELEKKGFIYSQDKVGYFVGKPHFQSEAKKTIVRKKRPQIPTVESVIQQNLNGGTETMQEKEKNSGFENSLLNAYKNVLTIKKTLLYTAPSVEGDLSFRKSIATFLNDFYSIQANPAQIVVASGKENLLRNIVQLKSLCMPSIKPEGLGLLHLAEQVSDGKANTIKPTVAVVEDTENKIKRIFTNAEIPVREIPVDDMGMNIDFLSTSGATLAYVTPKDVPFGSMENSDERKHEILDWANSAPYRYVIEFDSQISPEDEVSFKSADEHDKVIYINSFGNFLCPGINASFAVLPKDVAADYHQHYKSFECPLSYLDQLALTEFITHGHLKDYLNSIEQL